MFNVLRGALREQVKGGEAKFPSISFKINKLQAAVTMEDEYPNTGMRNIIGDQPEPDTVVRVGTGTEMAEVPVHSSLLTLASRYSKE